MRSLVSLIFMRPLHEGEVMSHYIPLGRFRRNLVKELTRVFFEVLHTSLTLKFVNFLYTSTAMS